MGQQVNLFSELNLKRIGKVQAKLNFIKVK